MNAPRLDPTGQLWRAMTANSEETLDKYRTSSSATRKETRRILDGALVEVEPRSLEGQALAYLVGRLDQINIDEGG